MKKMLSLAAAPPGTALPLCSQFLNIVPIQQPVWFLRAMLSSRKLIRNVKDMNFCALSLSLSLSRSLVKVLSAVMCWQMFNWLSEKTEIHLSTFMLIAAVLIWNTKSTELTPNTTSVPSDNSCVAGGISQKGPVDFWCRLSMAHHLVN